MSSPSSPPAHGSEAPANSRSDFFDGIGWIAFGIAVVIGSWTMDRLEAQDVNPYTVPGLLPGLLGIAIIFFGSLMLFRGWRQGALRTAASAVASPPGSTRRLWLAVGLCVTFDVLLVGRGLPFWLAAAMFVTVTILTLQYGQRKTAGLRLTPGTVLLATAIGLGAGLVITLVFQEIFLVRLP